MIQEEYDALWMRPRELSLTGEGRALAIIDQPLWLGNPEYQNNLGKVIKNHNGGTSMHGAAVVSIAVGSTIGVAPRAKAHYTGIETWAEERFLQNHATALRDLRTFVESGQSLDCISTSHNWTAERRVIDGRLREDRQGAAANDELVLWFEERNIPVFSARDMFIYSCGHQGPAAIILENWQDGFDFKKQQEGAVAIPVDDRLLACPRPQQVTENGGSPLYRMPRGGKSWAVPVVAGYFLLARQAMPDITRQQFLQVLSETAKWVDFDGDCRLPVADMKAFCAKIEDCLIPQRHDKIISSNTKQRSELG